MEITAAFLPALGPLDSVLTRGIPFAVRLEIDCASTDPIRE